MKIIKFYNKIESKMTEKMTFEKKSNEDTFKTSWMLFIIVILALLSFYFFENEFQKSEGTYRLLALGIVIAAAIVAILYFRLLINETDRKNNSIGSNIDEDINNERTSEFGDELYKVESNEESQKNSNDEDNLMTGIFEMFSENEIYKKGKGTFGLENYSFESKTQLAVILCVIKFDSHKHKFFNLAQKTFLLKFKENFKNGFSLGDKEFKDKINFTESFFSSIKKDLFEFDKMNNNILRLNQNSQYYQLYNDFLKILIAKNI